MVTKARIIESETPEVVVIPKITAKDLMVELENGDIDVEQYNILVKNLPKLNEQFANNMVEYWNHHFNHAINTILLNEEA
ncbi:hypothetical protein LCGC14_0578210 [marine sediment metagenome]|uniref:Uncharacterized protein n=1 Tax=marine sediment metagenome TaxID=412755 RepID=A0A0F9RH88_9ZZZZ